MTTSTPRGLGRGLGELFQRTDPVRPPQPGTAGASAAPGGAGAQDRASGGYGAAIDPTPRVLISASPPDPVAQIDAAGGPAFSDALAGEPIGTAGAGELSGGGTEDVAPLHPIPEGSSFAEIPVDAVRPNPRQPRTVFDEDALAELVDSIGEVGLLQPIVVRPREEDEGGGYELVMGERRWRAAQSAGMTEIPAIIRRTEDHDLLRDALLENLHRAQLNPLEEAAAYQQLLEEFDCTQEELAQRIKRSRPQISNTIRLLRLPPTVQRRVAAGVLSAGHARALLMVDDPAHQERLAQRVVAEGLSVRGTEELVTLREGADRPAPRHRSPRGIDPAAAELASALSDHLDTRVTVDLGKTKGRVTVEVASIDDLRRIAKLMGISSDMSINLDVAS